jgi:hypothetical protein
MKMAPRHEDGLHRQTVLVMLSRTQVYIHGARPPIPKKSTDSVATILDSIPLISSHSFPQVLDSQELAIP